MPLAKKKKVVFGFREFFACTPQMLRRLGNALLGISSLGSSFAFLAEDKRVGMALLVFGVLGKFFTKFFSEKDLDGGDDDESGPDEDSGSDEDCSGGGEPSATP